MCGSIEARAHRGLQARGLAAAPPDTAGLDVLILCYPCWCGTMPMPVWTFLESCELAGKRILPMCTNEGSGMGRSEADIRRLCPEATVEKGLSVKGSAVEAPVLP